MELHWESSGEGAPVLLIMSLGMNAAGWWRTVPVLAERIPGAELHLHDGAAHLYFTDDDRIDRAVGDWLSGLTSPGPAAPPRR